MAIFKRKHLIRILAGRKTQTRQTHKYEWKLGRRYSVRDNWFSKPQGYIVIVRKFRQRLGDISQEDIQKEGCSNIWEFHDVWEEIFGQGSWNPEIIVIVYEFVLARPDK